ncbi:fumarylacetoacetate hydrolase family protein [Streptomyces sp. NPDC020898]|uniref:fumarylacetoacetate hydrolase family protein n=1 Tax=Streptomyces sp. NPDC020898 TaxID=3365101 RepID=UPI0037B1581C
MSARAADAVGEAYEGALDYAPVAVAPEKVVCGRTHILEMDRELPSHPTLFNTYVRALVAAYDDVTLSASATQMDWEAELGVVIGAEVRHADTEQAHVVCVANGSPEQGSGRHSPSQTPSTATFWYRCG